MKEWSFTLPSELPLWELESRWIPKFSKNNCKGQNPLNWGVPYIIGKILKLRCLKWARMTHLNISNRSYGQKKGQESIWFSTTKSQESPDFLACKWRATYHSKVLNKGYNFTLDFILVRGLHTKLWAPKFAKISTLGILGFPRQNDIWVLVLFSQPHFDGSVRSPLTLPKMGLESPLGLLKTQSSITGVKTPRLEVFFIPLKRSWSVDVQNGLAWAIWIFGAQVMVKRKVESRTGNFTPDH